jgi:luciferase family oxidoreductase group 1
MSIPLSILDLAPINKGESATQGIAASLALAQHAETFGYRRVWYAEHHNTATVASSATSVLIAHIAANTSTIRLGAGGVMLPNHSPLTIAEQFGTLATIHPGRIDLGVGRAPGADQATMRALRRYAPFPDGFPKDVQELQGYLRGESLVPGVNAVPGRGTDVPLYILGSSLFGARLAASLGLPFAFASHFAPGALHDALTIYRQEFTPGPQLDRPYAMASVNVIAADTDAAAVHEFHLVKRARVSGSSGTEGRALTDDEADRALESDAGRQIERMIRYAAVGTPHRVRDYLADFAAATEADELIVAHQSSNTAARLRSVALTADAWGHRRRPLI